ncbi:uncharacterized protein H6S33_005480 [Morchella sextelata]|uniref:uncharacterized protein n=1 Tax=Morchella sextelata TaxID=1174677 RepID=UPI001D04DD1C|nr:uncharacterized protein H6S33_005480 [Morchella sextelata]KAH0613594.1 hypothetical protein H6S33_005480 [Morchella sextelata]
MYTENIDTPIYLVRSYKDLVDQPEHPDLTGPPTPGRIYFTGKITTVLSLEQKIRTGSSNPYSRRKNQKSRPWLVLEVKNDGSFLVISLTTRNNLVWKGLKEKDARSFLPLGTTPGYEGRDNVELLSNVYGIFKGTSLIFLEVEKTVYRDSLGHCIGEITADGLDLVLRERAMYRLQTAMEEEAKRERAFAEREEHRLRIFLEREAQKLRLTQEREAQRLQARIFRHGHRMHAAAQKILSHIAETIITVKRTGEGGGKKGLNGASEFVLPSRISFISRPSYT